MNLNFRYKLQFLLFSILFANCSQRKQNLENILTKCYWDVLDKRYSSKISNTFKFGLRGQCKYFVYSYEGKQKTDTAYAYDDFDNIKNNTWSQLNDSLIEIRDDKILLLDYNKDTVKLKTIYSGDTVLLIKNCRTIYKD